MLSHSLDSPLNSAPYSDMTTDPTGQYQLAQKWDGNSIPKSPFQDKELEVVTVVNSHREATSVAEILNEGHRRISSTAMSSTTPKSGSVSVQPMVPENGVNGRHVGSGGDATVGSNGQSSMTTATNPLVAASREYCS